jgi:hypothetical protein
MPRPHADAVVELTEAALSFHWAQHPAGCRAPPNCNLPSCQAPPELVADVILSCLQNERAVCLNGACLAVLCAAALHAEAHAVSRHEAASTAEMTALERP